MLNNVFHLVMAPEKLAWRFRLVGAVSKEQVRVLNPSEKTQAWFVDLSVQCIQAAAGLMVFRFWQT